MPPPRRPNRLSGQRILVTGATGGVGGAIVDALAVEGASLVLSGRNEARLRHRAGTVGGEAVAADLAEPAGWASLLEVAAACDAIVCNAADPGEGLATEMRGDAVARTLGVNLLAPMVLAAGFLRGRHDDGRSGGLIFIGSIAGVAASPALSVYNASKFGLRGFSLALAAELRGTTSWATHVVPGYIAGAGMFEDSGRRRPRWVRPRTPGDVADAVVKALLVRRVEVWVAPIELRLVVRLAGLAPGLASALRPRLRPIRGS